MYANDEIEVFDNKLLTGSYVASSVYEFRSAAGVTILVSYDAHASSASATLDLKVEVSADNTNWVDYGTWSGGTFTPTVFALTQATNGPTATLILDELRARWIRISVKESSETGGNFGNVYVWAYPHCK